MLPSDRGFWLWEAVLERWRSPKSWAWELLSAPQLGKASPGASPSRGLPRGLNPKGAENKQKNAMIWDAEGIQQTGLQIHPLLPCSQPQPHPGWQQRFPQGRATPGRQEGPSSSHGCGLGAGWAGLGSPLRPGSLSA